MNVKIDTKDKFVEITPEVVELTANMADELNNILISQLNKNIPHLIFNAEKIERIDGTIIKTFCKVKEKFIAADASIVFCSFQPHIYITLDEQDLVDFLNITPTLSEAWDIIQMEEIERELFKDFDEETE